MSSLVTTGDPATIDACVEAITIWRRRHGHSEQTIALDTWVLNALGKPPQECVLLDLERVVMRSRSKSTRSTYTSRLRSCFDALRKMGVITTEVDRDLPTQRAPKLKPRPLTDRQVDLCLTRLEPPFLHVVQVALLTGARAMEVWALAGADLSDGLHGPELLLHGKGGKEESIPAHPTVVDIIEGYGTLGRIWPGFRTPQHLSTTVGQAMRAVTGDVIEFHQCRHTFGTRLMIASGNDLLLVSQLMRHSQVATTQGYVALADDRPRMAVDRLRLA